MATRRSVLAAAAISFAGRVVHRPASGSAQGATPEPIRLLFVDGDAGNDDNPGTSDEPFETIARATQDIEPGDRVEIAAGDYDDEILIDRSGTREAPIVFAPADGADVRVHDGGIRISADYVVLERLLVTDVSDDDTAGIYISGGTGVQLLEVTSRANDGDGVYAKPTDAPVIDLLISGGSFSENKGAGIAATGEDALVNLIVENVTVADNDGDGLQIERASQVTVSGVFAIRNGADDQRNGVFIKDVRTAEVGGVFTEANGHNGIALRASDGVRIARCISTANGHHGLDSIEDCSNITFVNNVSYANGEADEDKGLYVTATSGVTILNNVFFANAGDQIAFSDEGGAVENISSNHNLFGRVEGTRLIRWFSEYYVELSAYQAASGLDLASIAGDPRFVEPDENVYSLLPESPAINAGMVVADVTDDYAGQAPDIGAIEYRP